MNHFKLLAGIAVLTIGGSASTHAQAYGVVDDGRSVVGINPDNPDRQKMSDTGWQTAVPLTLSHLVDVQGANGAHGSAHETAVSSYENLSISADGSSTNSDQTGCFAWTDSYIGGASNARYRDQILIDSATLPIGTPVSLTLNFTATAATSASLGIRNHAYVDAYLSFDNYTTSSNGGVVLSHSWATNTSETYQASVVLGTSVGSYIQLDSGLRWNGAADSNFLGDPETNSFSLGANALTTVTGLTDGATFRFASGAAPVPEPSSLLALSGLGLLLLRRRQTLNQD